MLSLRFQTLPWSVLVIFGVVLATALGSSAQDQKKVEYVNDPTVVEVLLKPDRANPTGNCPISITFNGTIRTNGPATVKYTFTRSDGATSPVLTLQYAEAGVQSVATSWTIGNTTSLPRYSGWQAIKVLSPNVMESSHDAGSFEMACTPAGEKQDLARPNPTGDGTNPVQSAEKISPEVMAALQVSQQDEQARAAARQRSLEAERTQFEPAANAIVEAVKRSDVDLESYLAASKQFVEATDPKKFDIIGVNQKFSGPIRAVIDKSVGVPGVADFMQRPVSLPLKPGWPQSGQSGTGNDEAPNTICPGCETVRFEPPFEGLASEGDFGTRAIRPGPIRELFPQVRSAVLSAPHSRKGSGRSFNVPASARHVTVTVNLGSSWNIGLSGLGYAHVWLGLDMNVTTGGSAVCSAPHLEQDNFWTWAGGILTMSSRPPVPNFTQTCTFDRSPGDPTTYAANIFASVDGTFFGASGGFGEYKVVLGRVDVTYCP
jgi:hypothetical protein